MTTDEALDRCRELARLKPTTMYWQHDAVAVALVLAELERLRYELEIHQAAVRLADRELNK